MRVKNFTPGALVRRSYSEYDAWLQKGGALPVQPMTIRAERDVPEAAIEECRIGMERLYGVDVLSRDAVFALVLRINSALPSEGYRLSPDTNGFFVEGADASGVLYGVFELLLRLGSGEEFTEIAVQSAPVVARRVINHWDNLNGSVERGYAGGSIFYKYGTLSYDPARIRDYARMLSSIGVNVIIINNVNVTAEASGLISGEMLEEVAALAAIFRPYEVRIGLSVHFESPVMFGKLATADPLDSEVSDWWKAQANRIYRLIPDFSGFLVKADSEFRGGPHAVGRSQAEGANMLARALKPHGGVVYWRSFIYNCLQDWRDLKTDRPKAAYELFNPLDGEFDNNVILQIKNGPGDFQVREPNSPLLGGMERTRKALELQITQEYTGQQIDLYNLAVQWEEMFSAPVDDESRLRDIMGSRIDTIAAVANIGDDFNWTGHTLAQANLFAYGRLAWDPNRRAEDVIRQWVKLTFGCETAMVDGLTDMMMRSRGAYEKYTSPLGLGWMVNVGNHYGPSPEGYEFMKWGTYHRANDVAIGVDRTSRGTGYTSQYSKALAAMYDGVTSCPEELLLFFHRLPYDFMLKSGKTLLQHIYDAHFEGVEDVEGFIERWESLRKWLPNEAYRSVAERLRRQLHNAIEWRDVINTYFFRKTGTPDEKGRELFQ